MKKISTMVLGVFAVATISVNAQNANEYPPNSEPGKCYAKCLTPDEYTTNAEQVLVKEAKKVISVVPATYKNVTEKVLVREESKKIVTIPAVYETVTEKAILREAGKKLVAVPAVYETVTEKVVAKEESKKLISIAPKYKTITETVKVKEEESKWVRKRTGGGCLSQNPDDCIIMCYETTPAQYKTVTKQVLDVAESTREEIIPAQYTTISKVVMKTPPTTQEIEIPAEYQMVKKTIMKTPPRTEEVTIPAEYKMVTHQVVDQPAKTVETIIPAEYSTISKRVLVKKGGYSEWKEILCDSKVTNYTIRQIQDALTAKGYNVGPAGSDNIMGNDTKDALRKYQQANGLPVGNLNMETLKSLGVNY